jgi:truncated hemoglobin YjbI
MTDLYSSREYLDKNPQWHQEHSSWKAQQICCMLRRHGVSPLSLIEVGCGAGAVLQALHGQLSPVPHCIGYEISPHAFALARTREVPGLQFRLGSPQMDHPLCDLLLAIDVFEHVEDYLGFLRSLQPLAHWKIFHIPLDLSVVSLAKPFYLRMARDKVGHLHYFTRETALASLEQAGLHIVDWFYTSVEFDQGVHGRKRLQSIRKLLFRFYPDLAVRWLGGFSIMVLAN